MAKIDEIKEVLLPHQLSKLIFDVAMLLIYEADFCRTSCKLIQENLGNKRK